MADVIEAARRLKIAAQASRGAGQLEAAAAMLEEGIAELERLRASSDSLRADRDAASPRADERQIALAWELADTCGILGGTRRDQGDLRRAAAAYDAGFRYESDPSYGFHSSYNALNRLVTRILLRPESLRDPESLRHAEGLEYVDVPARLQDLLAALQSDVEGPRKGDPWAAGDLALTAALNGEEGEARRALEHLESLSPPVGVYEAYRSVLGELAALGTPRRDALRRASDWLARKVQ